jgi:hypothetical protein
MIECIEECITSVSILDTKYRLITMSFAKEILPNIWLGTKNALRDRPFRERNHIIRDVIVDSSFSTSVEPILTS